MISNEIKKTETSVTTDIRLLSKMAVFVALCCIAAYISIPLPFTVAMITALTIVMNLAAFLFTPKQTFMILLIYTLLGAAGLPVFTGGTAGVGKIMGPTGGFIISFLAAYPLVSLLKGKEVSFLRYFLVAVIVGMPITYIGGLLSMMLVAHIPVAAGLMVAVFPFIPGDILKAALAAYLAVKLQKVTKGSF